MSKLDDLRPNAAVRGILPDALVTVVSVQWFGSEALELTHKGPGGRLANRLLYRHDAVDPEELAELLEEGALVHDVVDASGLRTVSRRTLYVEGIVQVAAEAPS